MRAQLPPEPVAVGAEQWVVTEGIGPFAVTWARGGDGGGALSGRFFDDHPNNGGGLAEYKDTSRHILVEVHVWKDTRTTYLDHFLEAQFRDDETGRLHDPQVSLVTLFGNPVLLYCHKPPDCRDRQYAW